MNINISGRTGNERMLKELTHYTFNVCQNANLINNKEGTRRKIILKKKI